jgi:hypothetical protein
MLKSEVDVDGLAVWKGVWLKERQGFFVGNLLQTLKGGVRCRQRGPKEPRCWVMKVNVTKTAGGRRWSSTRGYPCREQNETCAVLPCSFLSPSFVSEGMSLCHHALTAGSRLAGSELLFVVHISSYLLICSPSDHCSPQNA